MTKGDIAANLFLNGYNCTQSVVLAFKDEIGIDEELLSKMSCGFGGGFSRMREVCGAVSGMVLAANLLWGYSTPETGKIKADHYKVVQKLMKDFQGQNGSYICAELLGVSGAQNPTPEARTPEYYKKRPCPELIRCAANILQKEILQRKISENDQKEIK